MDQGKYLSDLIRLADAVDFDEIKEALSRPPASADLRQARQFLLLYVVRAGIPEGVRRIAEFGADVNCCQWGHPLTAAVEAVGSTQVEDIVNAFANVVYQLVCAGADVNGNGGRPLQRAVENRNSHMVDVLMLYGADPTRPNANGLSAYDQADAEMQRRMLAHIQTAQGQLPTQVRAPQRQLEGAETQAEGGRVEERQRSSGAAEEAGKAGGDEQEGEGWERMLGVVPAHWLEVYRCTGWGPSDWGYGRLEIPKGSSVSFKQAITDEARYCTVFGEFVPNTKRDLFVELPGVPEPSVNGMRVRITLNNQPSKRRLTGFLKDIRSSLFGPKCSAGTHAVKALSFFYTGRPNSVGLGRVAIGPLSPAPPTAAAPQSSKRADKLPRPGRKRARSAVAAAAPEPAAMPPPQAAAPPALVAAAAAQMAAAATLQPHSEVPGSPSRSPVAPSPSAALLPVPAVQASPSASDLLGRAAAPGSDGTPHPPPPPLAVASSADGGLAAAALLQGGQMECWREQCCSDLKSLLEDSGPMMLHMVMTQVLPLLKTTHLALQFKAQPPASLQAELDRLRALVASLTVERDHLSRLLAGREQQLHTLQQALTEKQASPTAAGGQLKAAAAASTAQQPAAAPSAGTSPAPAREGDDDREAAAAEPQPPDGGAQQQGSPAAGGDCGS